MVPNRGRRKLWLVLGLLVVGLGYVWYTQRDENQLAKALEPELKDGWTVVRRPDRPGPYQRAGDPQTLPRGSTGRVSHMHVGPDGPVRVTLEPRDDVDQRIVSLTTEDGKPTCAVLEKR